MAARSRRSSSRGVASSAPFARRWRRHGLSRGTSQRRRGQRRWRSPCSRLAWRSIVRLPFQIPGSASPPSGNPMADAPSAAMASAHAQTGSSSPATRRASSQATAHLRASSGVQAIRTRTRSPAPSFSSSALPPATSFPACSSRRTAATISFTARTVRPRTVLEAGGLGLGRGQARRLSGHAPGDLPGLHGTAQERQLPQPLPDERPLAHGPGIEAQALARPVAHGAEAELPGALLLQQGQGQLPQHGPSPGALGGQLPEPSVGILPPQVDQPRHREPGREGRAFARAQRAGAHGAVSSGPRGDAIQGRRT